MSKEQEGQKKKKIFFNTIKYKQSIVKKITKRKGENNCQQKNDRKFQLENVDIKNYGNNSCSIKTGSFDDIKVDLLKLNDLNQNSQVKELEEDNIITTDERNNKIGSKINENNKTPNIIYPTFINKKITYSKFRYIMYNKLNIVKKKVGKITPKRKEKINNNNKEEYDLRLDRAKREIKIFLEKKRKRLYDNVNQDKEIKIKRSLEDAKKQKRRINDNTKRQNKYINEDANIQLMRIKEDIEIEESRLIDGFLEDVEKDILFQYLNEIKGKMHLKE